MAEFGPDLGRGRAGYVPRNRRRPYPLPRRRRPTAAVRGALDISARGQTSGTAGGRHLVSMLRDLSVVSHIAEAEATLSSRPVCQRGRPGPLRPGSGAGSHRSAPGCEARGAGWRRRCAVSSRRCRKTTAGGRPAAVPAARRQGRRLPAVPTPAPGRARRHRRSRRASR